MRRSPTRVPPPLTPERTRKRLAQRTWHDGRMSRLLALTIALLCATDLYGQALTPTQWVSRLEQGGLVIVLRHARSPREVPDEKTANPGNTTRERQLDQMGREDAAAIGMAMRTLKIPVGAVLA